MIIIKNRLIESTIIFSSLVIFLILLINTNDFWDGDSIEYGVKLKNLEGIKYWLFSSGWHLQYYFIYIENTISSMTGIKFKFIDDLINFITIYIIFKESNFILNKLYGDFSKNLIFLFNIILFLSPIWSLLLSSVLSFHFFCFAMLLLSIRKLNQTNNNFYLVLIFLSFGLKSLIFYAPFYNYFVYGKNLKKSLIILFFGILHYLFFEFFLINSGEFVEENYNNLNFNFLSITTNTLRFFSFIFIIILVFNKKICNKWSLQHLKISIVIFLIGIFPYVLVGKSSFLLSFHHWELRQSILIIFIIPIIYSLFIHRYKLLMILFFLIYPIFTFYSYAIKINNNIFEKDLLTSIEKVDLSDFGFVNLSTDFSTRLRISPNEINNLLIEHFPNTFFYNSEKELNDFYKNYKNEIANIWKIYPDVNNENTLKLKISSNGYRNALEIFKNIIGLNYNKKIDIQIIK